MSIRQVLSHNAQCVASKKVKGRLISIESDDWGSIRMHSKTAFENLVNEGVPIGNDHFNKYDSLESAEDIQSLLNVLRKFKGGDGAHPIFTVNTVVTNPDFDKIKKENFEKYYFESSMETLNREREGALRMWEKAISSKLFYPQYHGREHVNVHRWLESLKNGEKDALLAFEEKVFGIATKDTKPEYYMAACDCIQGSELEAELLLSLKEGLEIFREWFGIDSLTFIPPCYICSKNVLSFLYTQGVRGLQGKIIHFLPNHKLYGELNYQKEIRIQGRKSNNMVNLVRNVFFEPSSNSKVDWVEDAMKRIEIAFRWNNPAIISTHRVNFMGSISPLNRQKSLILLEKLLYEITIKWPDVEFVTSEQLVKMYAK